MAMLVSLLRRTSITRRRTKYRMKLSFSISFCFLALRFLSREYLVAELREKRLIIVSVVFCYVEPTRLWALSLFSFDLWVMSYLQATAGSTS